MNGRFDCLILKAKPTLVGFAEFGSRKMFPPPPMAGECYSPGVSWTFEAT